MAMVSPCARTHGHYREKPARRCDCLSPRQQPTNHRGGINANHHHNSSILWCIRGVHYLSPTKRGYGGMLRPRREGTPPPCCKVAPSRLGQSDYHRRICIGMVLSSLPDRIGYSRQHLGYPHPTNTPTRQIILHPTNTPTRQIILHPTDNTAPDRHSGHPQQRSLLNT